MGGDVFRTAKTRSGFMFAYAVILTSNGRVLMTNTEKAVRSIEQSASRITRLSQDISEYNEAHEGTLYIEKSNYGIVSLGSTGFASECQIRCHSDVLFSSFCVVCGRRQLSFKVSH